MSGNATSAPGPSIQSANAAADAATRCRVLPDTTNVDTVGPVPCGGNVTGVGACSSTTCAFVPLTPNEDTPARRGCPVLGQGVSSVAMASRDATSPACGVSCRKFRLRGMRPCPTASTVFMNPAMPAAASR
ncbi:hypothetical protein MYSI104531_27280 [Mycobacterium simiae]